MKIPVSAILKIVVFFAFLAFFASAVAAQPASAEKGRIRLDSIERLSGKARETVNVNVDGDLIKFAVVLLSDDDPEEKAIKEIALDLRGVHVRRLEFKAGGQYAEGDLADIRAQLRAPGWSKLVDVKGGGAQDWEIEDAEIYVATQDGRIEGLVVIVAEPRSLTVANVVGAIDLEKLKRLGGKLGLPKITINRRKITITTEETKKKP
ncbi:MAG TPA: DUF4252 domain-containing protein [Pyrinomonadaceae bacterium]